MKKYKVIWYNQDTVVKTDHVVASSKEDAISKAYMQYGGNGPAPMLSIEEE